MSEPPLLSIHYDDEITADRNGSVVFCSNQPLFIRMPRDVRTLVALKNFVAHAIGVYRLRDDDDVKLIRGWHKHFSTILLLELFVCLVDRCEGGSANAGDDTQSAGPASRNIRRMMFNLNESPGSSNEGFNYGSIANRYRACWLRSLKAMRDPRLEIR
ncbi:hypothetical protein PIB30_090537 [Stylosanthes scabra]|uniref:Uncharacterized protein n=1 Tax=Stylosanthes scabra TaxID=79078 RepID=A0ABU6RU97_9FABA|nr:hypothetical protein [Stylosanthes scabra]